MVSASHRPAFIPILESLRGVSALLVACYHISSYPLFAKLGLGELLAKAYLSVDLFFVLSGFVMSHVYLDKIRSTQNLFEYLWLRAGRVWPLHLITALPFAVFFAARAWESKMVAGFAANIFLLQATPIVSNPTALNFPSWSVSAEAVCYAFFGAIQLAVSARGWRFAVNTLIIVASLAYCLFTMEGSLNNLTLTHGFARGALGFFLGVIAFELHELFLRRRAVWRYSLISVICVSVGVGASDLVWPFVFAVVVGILATSSTIPPWAVSAIPMWLGRISYSTYLNHVLVASLLLKLTWLSTLQPVVAFALIIAVLCCASSLSYRLVEKSCRDWFRRRNPFAS
jgi:peptidoglycan/LPS O-acetylase OafA/YrhL